MKINVQRSLAKQAERNAQIKPLPKVIVKQTQLSPISLTDIRSGNNNHAVAVDDTSTPSRMGANTEQLLKELYQEFGNIKRERGKLSSQTAYLVARIADRLAVEEGKGVSDEFLKGNFAMPEIIEHYMKIEALTDQGARIWDDIRHVKEHGKQSETVAPTVSIENNASTDIKAIKHELIRLKDLICKTKSKIEKANGGLKKPKNSDRVLEWKEKIAMAEARRLELKVKLSNA